MSFTYLFSRQTNTLYFLRFLLKIIPTSSLINYLACRLCINFIIYGVTRINTVCTTYGRLLVYCQRVDFTVDIFTSTNRRHTPKLPYLQLTVMFTYFRLEDSNPFIIYYCVCFLCLLFNVNGTVLEVETLTTDTCIKCHVVLIVVNC